MQKICEKICIYQKFVVPLQSNSEKDILRRVKRSGQRWGATRKE